MYRTTTLQKETSVPRIRGFSRAAKHSTVLSSALTIGLSRVAFTSPCTTGAVHERQENVDWREEGNYYIADEMFSSAPEKSNAPRMLWPRLIGVAPRYQGWNATEPRVIRTGPLVEREVHSAGLDHGHYHHGYGKRHYIAIKGLQSLAFI